MTTSSEETEPREIAVNVLDSSGNYHIAMKSNPNIPVSREAIVRFFQLYTSEMREIADWLGVSRSTPVESDLDYARRILLAAKEAGKADELVDRVEQLLAKRRPERAAVPVSREANASPIRWQRVNDEPFEYAIQQGAHGDEFIKLIDGSCLRREANAMPGREELTKMLSEHVEHVRHYLHMQIGKPKSKHLVSAPETALDDLLFEMNAVLSASVPAPQPDMERAREALQAVLDWNSGKETDTRSWAEVRALAKDSVAALPAQERTWQPPEGWKLVPVELTPEMLDAAFHQANASLLSELGNSHCKTAEERSAFAVGPLYRAMLAASPAPPHVAEQPIDERQKLIIDWLRWGLEEICRGTDMPWEFGIASDALKNAGFGEGAIQKPTRPVSPAPPTADHRR